MSLINETKAWLVRAKGSIPRVQSLWVSLADHDDTVGLKVNIKSRDDRTVDYLLVQKTEDVNIAQNTSIGDSQVILESGHSASAGQILTIKEAKRTFQAKVLAVSVNILTIDSPLDFAFTTNASTFLGTENMAVNGSTNPQTFEIGPPPNTIWQLNRIIGVFLDDNEMSDDRFAGIPEVTNGAVLRKSGNEFKHLLNTKKNSDYILRSFNFRYSDKAGAGNFGAAFEKKFGGEGNNGAVIRIEGDLNEKIQNIIQDDLTAIVNYKIVVQGHILTS